MRRTACIKFLLIAALSAFFISSASAFERPLKTVHAEASEVKGVFTLILYGARYGDDLQAVAILDLEGDEYTFEPYAADFNYKVEKGIPAKEAIERAEKFVRWHRSFWRSRLSRILDKKGNAIGYELRPLYYPLDYGTDDVLDISYWLKKDNRIKVVIRLLHSVERMIEDGGGGLRHQSH